MKLRAILLFLMIIWDTSLHWVEILGKETSYELYPSFPLFGIISYNLFWVIFWTLGSLIMLTLLGSGVTVKHKTVIKNYIDPKNKKAELEIKEEIKNIKTKLIEKDNGQGTKNITK